MKSMKMKEFQRFLTRFGFLPIKGDHKHLKYVHQRTGELFLLPNHPGRTVDKAYQKKAREIISR